MDILLWLLALVLVLLGLVGIVLPALPGISLVFIGLLLAGYADNFEHVGFPALACIALLAVVSVGADILATKIGVEKSGASKVAIIGAMLGSVIGLFFAPIGLVIGPFVGAVCGELLAGREGKKAVQAGFGAWVGMLLGYAMKFLIAFSMIAIFILAYIW